MVRYDKKICTHSTQRVKSLPAMFDIKKTPCVNVNGSSLEAIKKTISQYPSGTLTYEVARDVLRS